LWSCFPISETRRRSLNPREYALGLWYPISVQGSKLSGGFWSAALETL
jgi:hypothetical protein